MLANKLPKHRLSASPSHPTLLLVFFIMLSGCSSYVTKTDAPVDRVPAEEGNLTTEPGGVQDPPENMTNKPLSSQVCVYESTKGIAEITEIGSHQVVFKFYPGDQYFQVATEAIPDTEIKQGQELKAIIRNPISGPCKALEFELLTTVK